jgi:hypothetical protein
MAVAISDLETLVNRYIHNDASTNSVSSADRLGAITEATGQIFNEFGFNQTINNTTIEYFDTINYYPITSLLPDFLEATDLRRQPGLHVNTFSLKTPRDIVVEIDLYSLDRNLLEDAFSIDLSGGVRTLIINHISQYPATTANGCDDLSNENGTWAIDQVNSDATNLLLDTVVYQLPVTASLVFDIIVGQSVNNKATIYNNGLQNLDCTQFYNIGNWVFWVYLPSVTNFSSVTFFWGSDTLATPATKANYYTASATTDYMGNAFIQGWNRISIPWLGCSVVGTPNYTTIQYVQVDYNYTGSQTSLTSWRLDNILIIRPEPLTLYYQSWYVGKNASGTSITVFGATTDVPFFSGQYDFFDIAVSHLAASILFREMGLQQDAMVEDEKATKEIIRLKKKFPSRRLEETRNFGVRGINFRRRKAPSGWINYGG